MNEPELTVKRVSTFMPVSAQDLLDAGIPLPPGMEPPPPPARLPRSVRWRMACAEFVASLRRRVGFWIAGYEPTDDWDW